MCFPTLPLLIFRDIISFLEWPDPPYRIWPKLKSQPMLRERRERNWKEGCDEDIQLAAHNRFTAVRIVDGTFLE